MTTHSPNRSRTSRHSRSENRGSVTQVMSAFASLVLVWTIMEASASAEFSPTVKEPPVGNLHFSRSSFNKTTVKPEPPATTQPEQLAGPRELPPSLSNSLTVNLPCRAQVPQYTPTPAGNPPFQTTLWTTCEDFGDQRGWNNRASRYYETIQFADVSGDGRLDVCGRFKDGIYCALGSTGPTRRSFGPAQLWSRAFGDTDNAHTDWESDEAYWRTIRLADVSGDGFADLCGRGRNGLYCATSNGSGFNAPTRWSQQFSDVDGWIDEAYWGTLQYVDLDRDGAVDVCGRGYTYIHCALSHQTGFDPSQTWSEAFSDNEGWGSHRSYWSTIAFPDVTGDGFPDICGRWETGLRCAANQMASGVQGFATLQTRITGSSYDRLRDPGGMPPPSWYETMQFADINGNGTDDVCMRFRDGMHCMVIKSYGNNRIALLVQTLDPPIETFGNQDPHGTSWQLESHYKTIRVVDVDGNDRADVCGRGVNGIYCALSKSSPEASSSYFYEARLFVDDFGDVSLGMGQAGWDREEYWETVQPANVDGLAGADWCGRGYDGIYCSEPISLLPAPALVSPPNGDTHPSREIPLWLTWAPVDGADTYEVTITNTYPDGNPHLAPRAEVDAQRPTWATTCRVDWIYPASRAGSAPLRWWVRACDADGRCGAWASWEIELPSLSARATSSRATSGSSNNARGGRTPSSSVPPTCGP